MKIIGKFEVFYIDPKSILWKWEKKEKMFQNGNKAKDLESSGSVFFIITINDQSTNKIYIK